MPLKLALVSSVLPPLAAGTHPAVPVPSEYLDLLSGCYGWACLAYDGAPAGVAEKGVNWAVSRRAARNPCRPVVTPD